MTRKMRAVQDLLPLALVEEDPALVLLRGLPPHSVVAGLDEVGRGPLAGPVTAAACILPDPLPDVLHALNDSKQLTEDERELLFPHIVAHALAFGVVSVEAPEIDALNILRASLHAMQGAFAQMQDQLKRAHPTLTARGAVVDGNQQAPLPLDVVQRTVVGGDAKSRCIMAASILAKVTRDRRMREEDGRFAGYGFAEHKGYGTPSHLAALRRLGPTPLHRRSFAPVREAVIAAQAAVAARADG